MIVPKNKIVTTNKKTLRKNVSKECCIVSINILMPSECRISLSILFKKKVNNSINNQIKLPFFFNYLSILIILNMEKILRFSKLKFGGRTAFKIKVE